MAKSRKDRKNRSRKNRKNTRRDRRRRTMRGGDAPVNDTSMNLPRSLNEAQGRQQLAFHEQQHGGGAYAYGPFPGAVTESSVLPANLVASAKLIPLDQAFAEIRGMTDQDGGRRKRKGKKSKKTRKGTRKGSRKQRGGLYRWGGGARSMRGGSYAEMRYPMPVSDEGKMLIPASLQTQAGLNPEWKLAENPLAFAPIAK